MSLTFGLDYRPVVLHPAGIGRYARGLVHGFSRLSEAETGDVRFVLLTIFYRHYRRELLRAPVPDDPRFDLRGVRCPGKLLRRLGSWTRPWLERRMGPVDVFHYTDYLLPPWKKPALVATLHDAAFLHPEPWLPPKHREWMIRWCEEAVRTSRLILTVSEASRNDLHERMGLDPDRIRVVPLAADGAFSVPAPAEQRKAVRKRYGIEGPYVLSVCTLEPRKNLVRLLAAFARWKRSSRRPEVLVLSGGRGWLVSEIDRALEGAGLEIGREVVVTGYVPDADLPALMQGASVFVYPSLWEGFGLPVLEAFAARVPVITSNLSSLPEVAGGAARLVDPKNEEEIAAALGELLEDGEKRNELARRGTARAREFSWERTARETLGVYREALS